MSYFARLHEDFIERARKPMDFGQLPVKPVQKDVPVIASSKWIARDKKLSKIFRFRDLGERNLFVKLLLDHEHEVQHSANLVIDEDYVDVCVWTRDINSITEIDKEYAKHADSLYKEVLYSTIDVK